MTASSYFDYRGKDNELVFQPFEPVVALSVSILEPAHRPASQLGAAFSEILADELLRIDELFQL